MLVRVHSDQKSDPREVRTLNPRSLGLFGLRTRPPAKLCMKAISLLHLTAVALTSCTIVDVRGDASLGAPCAIQAIAASSRAGVVSRCIAPAALVLHTAVAHCVARRHAGFALAHEGTPLVKAVSIFTPPTWCKQTLLRCSLAAAPFLGARHWQVQRTTLTSRDSIVSASAFWAAGGFNRRKPHAPAPPAVGVFLKTKPDHPGWLPCSFQADAIGLLDCLAVAIAT